MADEKLSLLSRLDSWKNRNSRRIKQLVAAALFGSGFALAVSPPKNSAEAEVAKSLSTLQRTFIEQGSVADSAANGKSYVELSSGDLKSYLDFLNRIDLNDPMLSSTDFAKIKQLINEEKELTQKEIDRLAEKGSQGDQESAEETAAKNNFKELLHDKEMAIEGEVFKLVNGYFTDLRREVLTLQNTYKGQLDESVLKQMNDLLSAIDGAQAEINSPVLTKEGKPYLLENGQPVPHDSREVAIEGYYMDSGSSFDSMQKQLKSIVAALDATLREQRESESPNAAAVRPLIILLATASGLAALISAQSEFRKLSTKRKIGETAPEITLDQFTTFDKARLTVDEDEGEGLASNADTVQRDQSAKQ